LIERAAGGCADEKKSDRDNDEQGRNRAGQAGQKVAQHAASLTTDREVDKPSGDP
jgi:hypothetical protein